MEVLVLLAAGVGVALLANRYQARRWRELIPDQMFEPEADIAATLALREAQSRQESLTALHLLYGLLQDEAFVAAIGKLGGDATKIEDRVDPSVGFMITAKPGDWVEAGEPLATVFASDRSGVESGRATLRGAIIIADEADPPLPLVSHRVTAAGAELLVGA